MWKSLERSTLLPLPRKKANMLLCLGSIASCLFKGAVSRTPKFKQSEISQNWKITDQNVERMYQHSKCNKRHGWVNMQKIETSCKCSFWKLYKANRFSKFIFVACNIKYNAWETFLFGTKLWLCPSQEISDQCRFLGNCPPTPPLTQHSGSIANKHV